MCDKVILENGETSKSVLGCYKNQEMCNKGVDNYPHALNLFLNVIRLKKCLIKKLIDIFLYLILFLINIKLKNYMT